MKFFHFDIGLKEQEIETLIEKTIGVEIKKFSFSTAEDGLEKLLVFKSENQVYFLENTSLSIDVELIEGFINKHSFRSSDNRFLMDIILLPGLKPNQSIILSSELIFQIKKMTGKFPNYQGTVSLSNDSDDNMLKVSQWILNEIFEQVPMKVGDFFKEPPRQFGLRGDDFLWEDLANTFQEYQVPESYFEFNIFLLDKIEFLTGKDIRREGDFFIEKYQGRGMSSGYISSETWINKIIPELIERFINSFPVWVLKS